MAWALAKIQLRHFLENAISFSVLWLQSLLLRSKLIRSTKAEMAEASPQTLRERSRSIAGLQKDMDSMAYSVITIYRSVANYQISAHWSYDMKT